MSIKVGSRVKVTERSAYKTVPAGAAGTVVNTFEEVLMVQFEEPHGGHEGEWPFFADELEEV